MDPITELMKVPQWTKIRAVICASICNVPIGAYYFFSNINGYIAAYLRTFDHAVTTKDTLIIMPLWITVQCFGTLLSIRLCCRFGYALVSKVAFSIFALVNLSMYFVTNYWLFVALYGILTGLAIGCGYIPPLYIVWTYYPEHKAIVTTMCLFISGISSAVLSPLSTYILDPNNSLSPWDIEGRGARVPVLFLVFFVIYGSIAVFLVVFQPEPFEHSIIKNLIKLRMLKRLHKQALNDSKNEKKLTERELELIKMGDYHQPEIVEFRSPSLIRPSSTRYNRQSSMSPTNNLIPLQIQRSASGMQVGMFEESSPDSTYRRQPSYHDIRSANDQVLSQREFEFLVGKEIYHETDGFITHQESFMLGALNSEQLAGMIAARKAPRALIEDRQEAIRDYIKRSLTKKSLQGSALALNNFNKVGHRDSFHMDTIEDLERDVLLLIDPVQTHSFRKMRNTDSLIKESMRLSLQKLPNTCPNVTAAVFSRTFLLICMMTVCCSSFNYFMNMAWKDPQLNLFWLSKERALHRQGEGARQADVSHGLFRCLRQQLHAGAVQQAP